LIGIVFPAGAYAEGTLYADRFLIGDGDSHAFEGDGPWSHGYNKVTGDVYGNVNALTLALRATTGTAPLTVASTTAIANLNADLLDGQHATAFWAKTDATIDGGYFTDSYTGAPFNIDGGAF